MNSILTNYHDNIINLCKTHKVKELYAFGSVLTSNFKADSDIDFIVDFLPQDILDYADNYFDFKFALEDTFNRKIDLLEDKAIKNPYFKQVVDQSKQLIYGHSN